MTFQSKINEDTPTADSIRFALLGPTSEATAQVRDLLYFGARAPLQVPNADAAAKALRDTDVTAAAIVSVHRSEEMLAQLPTLRARTEKPILVFTEDPQDMTGKLALQLGADLVLPIHSTEAFVQGSVRALLRRLQAYHDIGRGPIERMTRGPLEMDLSCHMATWRGKDVRLTATEFTLLHILAEHPMHIKKREHLQDAIYGNRIFVEDRTIDSHIKRLRQKLRAVDPDFGAIDTVYGVGYRFRHDVEAVRAAPRLQSVS